MYLRLKQNRNAKRKHIFIHRYSNHLHHIFKIVDITQNSIEMMDFIAINLY